jgi:hypothetical protein
MLNGSGIKVFSGKSHSLSTTSSYLPFTVGTSHPELAEIIARRYTRRPVLYAVLLIPYLD